MTGAAGMELERLPSVGADKGAGLERGRGEGAELDRTICDRASDGAGEPLCGIGLCRTGITWGGGAGGIG
jgi:hypothetical protein